MTGLVNYIREFGTQEEAEAAEEIVRNTLDVEVGLESLRQQVWQVFQRIKQELVECLEHEGYYISEEEAGHTQILFSKGRITCVNGDSFVQALDSLTHDHVEGLSEAAIKSVQRFRESYRWTGDYCPEDQPKCASRFVAGRSIMDLLLNSQASR